MHRMSHGASKVTLAVLLVAGCRYCNVCSCVLAACRYDFYQLLVELEFGDEHDTPQEVQALADTAFR